MARGGHHLLEHSRVGRRPVGNHLTRAGAMPQGAGEEPAGRRQVPLLCDEDIDDLALLVDRPVQTDPSPRDLEVGFVDEPPITGNGPARPGCVDRQRGEPLYPAIKGDVINVDTTFGQQVLDVSVRQPVPQIPAHSPPCTQVRAAKVRQSPQQPKARLRASRPCRGEPANAARRPRRPSSPTLRWVCGVGTDRDRSRVVTATVGTLTPGIGVIFRERAGTRPHHNRT